MSRLEYFSFFVRLDEFAFSQLFEVPLVADVGVQFVKGVLLRTKILLESAMVNLPEILEFLLTEEISLRVFSHAFVCKNRARQILLHHVVSNHNQRNQVAKLSGYEMIQLQVAAEHQVATEVPVLLPIIPGNP